MLYYVYNIYIFLSVYLLLLLPEPLQKVWSPYVTVPTLHRCVQCPTGNRSYHAPGARPQMPARGLQ